MRRDPGAEDRAEARNPTRAPAHSGSDGCCLRRRMQHHQGRQADGRRIVREPTRNRRSPAPRRPPVRQCPAPDRRATPHALRTPSTSTTAPATRQPARPGPEIEPIPWWCPATARKLRTRAADRRHETVIHREISLVHLDIPPETGTGCRAGYTTLGRRENEPKTAGTQDGESAKQVLPGEAWTLTICTRLERGQRAIDAVGERW